MTPERGTRAAALQRRLQRRVDDLEEWYLARAYAAGRSRGRSRLPDEDVGERLIARGGELREAALRTNEMRFAASGHQVLLYLQERPLRSPWLRGLSECLRHAGVRCSTAVAGTASLKTVLEVARPTIVIAFDGDTFPSSADLAELSAYKASCGCFRLFVANAPFPHRWGGHSPLAPKDAARLRRALAGGGPDGMVSMFSEEYYRDLMPEWAAAGLPFLSLPPACNPFVHYPRPGRRTLDYFMVATKERDRIRVARRYLVPVFREYYGEWAGVGWRFGEGLVPGEQLAAKYAQSRIAINPLHSELTKHPLDVSERTFTAAACGACVLTDRTPLGERFFSRDEVACVGSPSEFRAALRHYLGRRQAREELATRAMERAYSEHTYFHRAERLLAFIDDHD